MKPTHLYKTTDKLLKGKQLLNISNDDTQGKQKRHYYLTACVFKKDPPLSFPVVYDPPFDTGSDVFLINPMIFGYKKETQQKEIKEENEEEKEKEEKDLKEEKSEKFVAVDEKMIMIFDSPRKLFSIVKQFNGLNGHLEQLRLFTTTAGMRTDNCLPPPEPAKPRQCIIPEVKPPCTIPTHSKWEGCDKICMPCCCPAIESCREIRVPRLNTCKKIEYRLPSFGECKKSKLPRPCPKECCYLKYICPYETVGSSIRPLISVQIRQAWILGRKTSFDHLKHFSTSAASRKEEDCKKAGVLPCLKASDILGTQKKKSTGMKQCEKICMPCCAPARDPPDCFYPYVKPECIKLRPPRPAYSECKKDMMKSPKPCECLIPRPPPCRRSEDSKGCAK